MTAIKDITSFFQEESMKVKKNSQPTLPHTTILERVFAALIVSKFKRRTPGSER
jgi:hypothetical protein